MPEITLHNLSFHYTKHEPFLRAMLLSEGRLAIKVACEGIKVTSLASTLRTLFAVLQRNGGAGLIPADKFQELQQVWRFSKIRTNSVLLTENTLLFSPQTFNEIVHLRYRSPQGYMPTFNRERVAETRIALVPITEDRANSLAAATPPNTLQDVTTVGSLEYTPSAFLAVCELKNVGFIPDPVTLFHPPPLAQVPPHSHFTNIAVLEDGENLLIL